MKNKEKYIDFLTQCIVDDDASFGVDNITGEPKICSGVPSKNEICCLNCKFGKGLCKTNAKLDWLEEEADIWSEFRDLKRGDVVFVKKGTIWMPVLFVNIVCGELIYTSCVDNDGCFTYNCDREDDPRKVRKDIRPVVLRYEFYV